MFPTVHDKVLIHQRYHAFVTDFVPCNSEDLRRGGVANFGYDDDKGDYRF